jgi:hypothetical protein
MEMQHSIPISIAISIPIKSKNPANQFKGLLITALGFHS